MCRRASPDSYRTMPSGSVTSFRCGNSRLRSAIGNASRMWFCCGKAIPGIELRLNGIPLVIGVYAFRRSVNNDVLYRTLRSKRSWLMAEPRGAELRCAKLGCRKKTRSRDDMRERVEAEFVDVPSVPII